MKRAVALLLLALMLLPALTACDEELPPLSDGEIRVCFIDVGEGDCALIQTASAAVLVDTGEADDALTARILDVLADARVEKLDCLILTHPHSDHVGGTPGVLAEIPVGECLMPRAVDENEAFGNALDALLAHGVRARIAESGKSFTYGDLTFDVLSPGPDSDADDPNDLSAILRFTYGEATLLMMADVGTGVEEDLLQRYSAEELSATLLKVGHHGADTSSSYAFLSAVSPTYAVISVGSENAYGHPHDETLRKLEAVGVAVYRTDRRGTIIFTGTREGFTLPE